MTVSSPTTRLPVFDAAGKEVETFELNPSVFDGVVNRAAMYQVVTVLRARSRKGLAATKTRGEVSGGGKKPWRQKGTGRSRHGSIRSPLWRHGGVVFGPHPRDFGYSVPKAIARLALKSSLNAKVKENGIIVVRELLLSQPKTKEAWQLCTSLKMKSAKARSILLLTDKKDERLQRAFRNIVTVDVRSARDTNAYDVLTHRTVITSKDGLQQLTDRLS